MKNVQLASFCKIPESRQSQLSLFRKSIYTCAFCGMTPDQTIKRVQKLGDIAIILITHNEIHARLIADRFTFLSLGEVIGSGSAEDLAGDDIKRLMAGGAEIGDLAKELEGV